MVKANTDGWWVADIVHGRWGVEETARKIFQTVSKYRPISVGIEKGALKNAVLPYISENMKKNQQFFRIEELTHGNQKKTDRIIWALQGRIEQGMLKFNKGRGIHYFLINFSSFPTR